MTYLIVNADDFGLHSAINEGIEMAFTKGIVTSTSMMASGAAFDEAVTIAKRHPTLGIGVHLTLVGGVSPVSDPSRIPSLLTGNVFPETYTTLMKRSLLRQIKYQELYEELDAQIRKVVESGVNVTHIDGHQHMHMLPNVLPVVIALAKQYNISCIRVPDEEQLFTNGVTNIVRILGKAGLSAVSSKGCELVDKMHMKHNHYFWGMINGGDLQQDKLLSIIDAISEREGLHEIMTHPGLHNDVLRQLFSWGYHWEEECAAMCAPAIQERLLERNIQLVNYGNLA